MDTLTTDTLPNNNSCNEIFKMFRRLTPAKPIEFTDIDDIITPPTKRDSHCFADTPSSSTPFADDLNSSINELTCRPLGRFLSFDVKRSLFSSKRPADTDDVPTGTIDDYPAAKRLCIAVSGICQVSLESSTPQSFQSDIKSAVHRLSTETDLTADGSRPYTLPTIAGKHQDLKSISHDTMSDVLSGCYDDKIDHVTIIDCRYPYEFEGGHIKGAVNLYTRDMIHTFLATHRSSHNNTHILIFHCEFSSERGPKMYRFLRSEDRAMNKDSYPSLYFPEVYLLDSGYKTFFNSHVTQCSPQTYKPMLHKDHASDLRHFRGKSKSWSAGEKSHNMSRLSLRF